MDLSAVYVETEGTGPGWESVTELGAVGSSRPVPTLILPGEQGMFYPMMQWY